MAIKKGSKYYCSVCESEHASPAQADVCRESHDMVYVPLKRTDLNRLINFIHSKNDDYLTESLVKTLRKYLGRVRI